MQPGVFYHIYNRGNNHELIFLEEENYRYFLRRFKHYLSSYVDTYAYCLMPDHFHFLVYVRPLESKTSKVSANQQTSKVSETFEVLTPVQKAFKNFFISYAKSFNKRYKRTGSLFQYKFKRKAVTSTAHILVLIPYIHLNPVHAGLCPSVEDWEFSSYITLIGDRRTSLKRDAVLELYDGREGFIRAHQRRNFESLANQTSKISESFEV